MTKNNSLEGCSDTIATRFWEKVKKTDTCWLWTATLDKRGYGIIGKGGRPCRMFLAHRLSWILHYGAIPDGLFVLHDCPGKDNRACVNPAHLWLGNALDNSKDMVSKGMSVRGKKNWECKLTPENVKIIRDLLTQGISCADIASRFDVHRITVYDIKTERTWAWLI